ncbi:transposase [Streptomyces sp. NPDC048484]|uniref:IS701 family transposase n=1 Tax=Streptomyces sp. NPDC048484 TaxID=3155146 RepID=UPI00342A6368
MSARAGAIGGAEEFAAQFDDLFFSLAQWRGFREYLTGLLAPRERNKTITCLAGAEPVTGAGRPGVQRLHFFLSESPWEAERVNDRRLELLREQDATAPHDGGVIVIDDSGDRKDGTATANVGRQWLGRLGKTDNGIVTVTTVWTDGRVYYPLHAHPYTPAHHFARGRSDPAFCTKPQLSAALLCSRSPREGSRLRLPGGGRRLCLLKSATTGTSHCARPAWPTWSRSSRTAAPGPRPISRTLPLRLPSL